MERENNVENKNEDIDIYLKDVVSKAKKEKNTKNLSDEEIKKSVESTEFLKKIEEIEMPDEAYKVIFTDGQMQLLYDDGEFYEISTTDSRSEKKKLEKKQARDRYIEYFIKYTLNPMIVQNKMKQGVRAIEKVITPKNREQNKVKDNKNKENIHKQKEVKSKAGEDEIIR